MYNYNLIPFELSKKDATYIICEQFAVWTEFIYSVEYLEYAFLLGMPAFAENVWSTPEKKKYYSFIERLNLMHSDYWKANGMRLDPKLYVTSVY